MIRLCSHRDIDTIYDIINDSARAYEGHIPDDCYHQPYMPQDELRSEIADGVVFYGYEEDGSLVGVMGIQDRGPVTLVRHAYTRTERCGEGIGSKLLEHLLGITTKPVMIGTWRGATRAVMFYLKPGFRLASVEDKDRLLREYWPTPHRQVETSVVLVDERTQQGLSDLG